MKAWPRPGPGPASSTSEALGSLQLMKLFAWQNIACKFSADGDNVLAPIMLGRWVLAAPRSRKAQRLYPLGIRLFCCATRRWCNTQSTDLIETSARLREKTMGTTGENSLKGTDKQGPGTACASEDATQRPSGGHSIGWRVTAGPGRKGKHVGVVWIGMHLHAANFSSPFRNLQCDGGYPFRHSRSSKKPTASQGNSSTRNRS